MENGPKSNKTKREWDRLYSPDMADSNNSPPPCSSRTFKDSIKRRSLEKKKKETEKSDHTLLVPKQVVIGS